MSILPTSLAGRLALVIAGALLIVQILSVILILESRHRLVQERQSFTVERFVDFVERADQRGGRALANPRRGPRWSRSVSQTSSPLAEAHEVDPALTAMLRSQLEDVGRTAEGAVAAMSVEERGGPDGPVGSGGAGGSRMAMVLSMPMADGRWLNATIPSPTEDPIRLWPLLLQTLLAYGVILSGVLMIAGQVARPLSTLTKKVREETFDGKSAPLTARGPSDVRELTDAFNAMHTRIELLFDEKDMILGSVGHDLRTPLTSLRLRTEQVTDEAVRDKMIATIEEMERLLSDIVFLARGDRGEIAFVPILVSALIEDTLSSVPNAASMVTVASIPDVSVRGMPTHLRRALRNILENACRYADGAIIRVDTVGGRVNIFVEDEGPGVADEDLAALRQPFTRGEQSRNKETGGAGLGLAIVDVVARSHGGDLRLENRREGGFRATLSLPIAD